MNIYRSHIFCIIVVAIVGILFPDSGYYDLTYGPVSSSQLEHPTISMESEVVLIEPDSNGASINAEFVFFNDGPPTEVTMFFPLTSSGDSTPGLFLDGDYGALSIEELNPADKKAFDKWLYEKYGVNSENPKKETILYKNEVNFRVNVDGVSIPVLHILETEIEDGVWLMESEFTRWKVKFKEGEVKKIDCSYRTPYNTGKFLYEVPILKYILSSGAGWSKSIKSGTITIKRSLSEFDAPLFFLPPDTFYETNGLADTSISYLDSIIAMSDFPPAEVNVSGDIEEITWKFTDYEPEENTILRVYTGLSEFFDEDRKDDFYKDIGLTENKYIPGISLKDGQNFRTAPSVSADLISKRPQLSKGELFNIIGAEGEWWNIRLKDGTEGWIRWRYHDTDTGELYIHASLLGFGWYENYY